MHTPKNRWDVERAAAWLRKHTWGAGGEETAPVLDQAVVTAAALAEAEAAPQEDGDEEIDIAGWPALVAPFYR